MSPYRHPAASRQPGPTSESQISYTLSSEIGLVGGEEGGKREEDNEATTSCSLPAPQFPLSAFSSLHGAIINETRRAVDDGARTNHHHCH